MLRDGSLFWIGSDDPAAPAAGVSGAEPARRRRRSAWPLRVLALVVIGGGAVAFFHQQTRPPRVTVTPQEIDVESLLYGDR